MFLLKTIFMKFAGEQVVETEFWRVYLAENQTYLGYCVISLKRRDCPNLADVTNEEMLDFLQLVKKLEDGLRKAFDATMFNWSCLMNLSYQNTPPDPHVHWHFRPRYNHEVQFAGTTFTDTLFGQHYEWPPTERLLDGGTRDAVVKRIQECI